MTPVETQAPERFSFRSQPFPVPGDLRIQWRVALITLMLGYSRAEQASVAKLHILNDAIRASRKRELLDLIISAKAGMLPWVLRVEPAFARAMDFVVGDNLAVWAQTADRTALKLTPAGSMAFERLRNEDDILTTEKSLLTVYAKKMTETSVTAVIGARGNAA